MWQWRPFHTLVFTILHWRLRELKLPSPLPVPDTLDPWHPKSLAIQSLGQFVLVARVERQHTRSSY